MIALPYTPEELEEKYPPRPSDLVVTRFGPSPTGFLHLGGLYAALISERFAHQQNGIFILRIEDTDKKREVAGAGELIRTALTEYGISIDEGPGNYGPYRQSERAELYTTYANQLLTNGLAYLCFATFDELEMMRSQQEAQKVRPGYWGPWAIWRHKSAAEVAEALASGLPYVIRLKSTGDIRKRITVIDAVKGSLELPENDQDIVLIKSDGLPTYHLAHVVDDHLMRTTHALRGDEWLSSLPLHLQLFSFFDWNPPIYGHIAPIQKLDGSSKRKLSKRKDPEASIDFYEQEGYPTGAVIEYLLTLVNAGFEEWRLHHLPESTRQFSISLEQLSKSGALFDIAKLQSTSQEYIARMSAASVYADVLVWANKYDQTLAEALQIDESYSIKVLEIERDQAQARKDIAKWSDIRPAFGFFFDQIFTEMRPQIQQLLIDTQTTEIKPVLVAFLSEYRPEETKDEWFARLKQTVQSFGYAESLKEYKANPASFKGHVGDVAKVLRIVLTGSLQSPDLSQIMRVLGVIKVMDRLAWALD